MEKKIYCGRGGHIPYTDYMHLINLTFGFETPETQFLGLLPKLYREERNPQNSNYVVTEDGTLCAAIGAYDHELIVCGETLACRGIGNVAVHPEFRSRGYMKLAMEAALDDMVKDGIAISSLGGRRQRYQYFSYDRCGPCYNFSLNRDNLRHVWGDMSAPFNGYKVITDHSDPLLDAIKALSDSAIVSPVRTRADFLDVCNSWKCNLIAITHDGELKGYAVMSNEGSITEVRSTMAEDFLPLLRSILVHSELRGITLVLPPFETAYIAASAPVCEWDDESCSMMYTVLNYQKVLSAFMKLKASYTRLPDGEISLLIHGRGGDERLMIRSSSGIPTVSSLSEDTPVDMELEHLEAMNLLFAPISPKRQTLSDLWKLWFPLPLWIYRADEV